MTTTSAAATIRPTDLPALLESSIKDARDEMDANRDIPPKLLAELRDAGAFRLLTPHELGGFEAPLTSVLEVYEGFGRVDASVAWTVWNANWGFLAALLGEAGTARVWPDREEPVFANSGAPGIATSVDGGYRVSGTWKIVSGVNGADWVVLVAVIMVDGAPRLTDAGAPDVRLFILETEQVSIQDTWHVSGLLGSGSNDVVVENALVPDDLVARFDLPAGIQRPLYEGSIPALIFPGCTAIALGVAQASIDAAVDLLKTKKDFRGGMLAAATHAQAAIGRSEAAVEAARLLLHSAAETLYAATDADVTMEQRAALRAAMSHGAQVCRETLVAMYALASSSSIYLGNPLERLFRDGMVTLQHALHSPVFFETAGRIRLGDDPGLPLF
jgi:alkylation response protein AidB-like acyl-CoA dehydrogenase